MRLKLRNAILLLCGGGILSSAAVAVALWSVFAGIRRDDSVDVMAGRFRYSRCVLGIRVRTAVMETDLSRMYREIVGEPPAPVWRLNYLPGDDGSYVDADGLGDSLALSLAGSFNGSGAFSREAKAAAITAFLALLQQDKPSQGAAYVRAVGELGRRWERAEKGEIQANDLPRAGAQGSR